jgi:Flp pilus assembly protein CpaB
MQDQTIIILAVIAGVVVLAAIILSKKMQATINKEGFEIKTDKGNAANKQSQNNIDVTKVKKGSNIKITKPNTNNVKIDNVSDSKIDIK